MAILKNIECTVTIDDEALPEYDRPAELHPLIQYPEDIEGPGVEKFIESQSGKNFAVQVNLQKDYRSRRPSNAVLMKVFVDGNLIQSKVIKKHKFDRGSALSVVKGVETRVAGTKKLSKLRFRDLKTQDQTSANHKPKTVGQIRVICSAVKASRRLNLTDSKTVDFSAPKVSEKDTKGGALDACTMMDPAISQGEDNTYSCDCERIGEHPVATFLFHYRSKGLQNLGIVEKSPETVPLEDRDPASLTPDEMVELLRRTKEIVRQQEETEKFMKKRLRQAEARHTLRTLDAFKRARSPSPVGDDVEDGDKDVQIVKRAKRDRKITIIDLD